jgi:hypothetical protein
MPNVEAPVIDATTAAERKSEMPAPPYTYLTEEAQLAEVVRDLAQPPGNQGRQKDESQRGRCLRSLQKQNPITATVPRR